MAKKTKKNTNNHDDFLKNNNDTENYTSELMQNQNEEEYASMWCSTCRDTTIFIDNVCSSCGTKKNKNKSTNQYEVDEEKEFNQILPEDNLYDFNDDYLDLNYDDNNDDF